MFTFLLGRREHACPHHKGFLIPQAHFPACVRQIGRGTTCVMCLYDAPAGQLVAVSVLAQGGVVHLQHARSSSLPPSNCALPLLLDNGSAASVLRALYLRPGFTCARAVYCAEH